ncbi:MAG: hypothetical protein GY799_13410 [Desulfobulbaceae bacterium]|nr:hypothetical protein [Desulfobulbaceae bacterium]
MAFTCRLPDQALAEIERIKSDQGIKTSSKAIEYVLQNFRAQGVRQQHAEGELRVLKKIITDKALADKAYDVVISDLIPAFEPITGTPGKNGIKTSQKLT